jgi:hypothetical protein
MAEQVTSRTEAEAFLDSPAFEFALAHDDGSAAKAHLAAGHPIYIGGGSDHPGQIVRLWPDGRRQLVSVDDRGSVSVIREIEPRRNLSKWIRSEHETD